MSFAELIPFADINDVAEIHLWENGITFTSRNGIRYFDFKNDKWDISYCHPGDIKPFEEIETKTPSWYPWDSFSYISTITHFSTKDNDFIITRIADESSFYATEDIIDIKHEKVYRIPYQDTKHIAVVGDDIWLGYRRGITRINTKTDKRMDYYVIPKFDHITGWIDYNGIRYMASDDGSLMAMEIDIGEISCIRIPDDLITKTLKISLSTRQLKFTNPVIMDGVLYIGFVPIDFYDHDSGSGIGEDDTRAISIVLLHNIEAKQWRYMELGRLGVRKLILNNGMIWCIGNRFEGYEGGDFAEFGGLVAIKGGQIISFSELESVPIRGFRIDGDIVSVLTGKYLDVYDVGGVPQRPYEPKEYADTDLVYKISTKTMKIESFTPISKDSPIVNQFLPLRFSLSDGEQEELSAWRVKANMTESSDRKIEVLSRRYFESGKK